MATTSNLATRLINAREGFIQFAMVSAGLTRAEAERALACMTKGGRRAPLKLDPVTGAFHFSHGVFAEADVIRRASTL